MSASDIKAGGAYVEIGGRLDKLDAALSAASSKVKAWGEGLTSIGTKLSVIGAGMLAPIVASAKAFADYGEQIGKLASKTGMSSEMLSGLAYAAESSEIAVGSVAAGVKGMQRAIAGGSKETNEAFAKLGTSAAALKNLSPDEQFSRLADALAGVADPAQKAAIAQQVFGRAGVELLPIIEGGSAELARMRREAGTLGLSLGKDATGRALELDQGLDRLKGGLKGVTLAIGNALSGGITPLIYRTLDCVVAFRMWIDANPQIVQSFAKIAVTVAAAGAAFVMIGTTIAALMSPALMTAAAIVGIGAAALAITDTLGVTAAGFGELFDSIRLGGTGLGTWLANIFRGIEIAWNTVTANMAIYWDVGATGIRAIWSGLAGAIALVLGNIVESFWVMGHTWDNVINTMIDTYNAIVSKVGGSPIEFRANVGGTMKEMGQSIKGWGGGMIDQTVADVNGLPKRIENRLFDRDTANAKLERDMGKSFGADFESGKNAPAWGIDTGRAKDALEQIGGNIWDSIKGAAEGALGKFEIPKVNWEAPGAKAAGGADVAWTQPKFSSVGTFSGVAGAQLGASGIFNQQLRALESIDRKMSGIERNTAEAGGLA
jgi:hypothetical protein